MRNKSTEVVYELIKKDKNVLAITADNGNEIYEKIRLEYPEQYIDYGIAESNMVASAAGLASKGKIPFLYAVTNFMSMRAYEFIRDIVCTSKANVKFIGRSSSMVTGTYGMTHEGTEDLALLRSLPNLVVITPASPIEAREATRFAYSYQGPVYIRIEAANEPELFTDDYSFEFGKGRVIRDGDNVTVFSMGSVISEAISAADELKKEGITVRVVNMPMVKPIDKQIIKESARKTGHIITLEEHSIFGGLGSSISEVIATENIFVKFSMMGLNGYPLGCGDRLSMRILNSLDSRAVCHEVQKIIRQ